MGYPAREQSERQGVMMGNRWLWALGLLLILAGGAVYFWMQPLPASSAQSADILVLGLDEVEGKSRSDTLLLAHLDAQGMVLMSVPRDLRVKFPDGRLDKINAAFALGAAEGGIHQGAQLASRVVSDFLGVPLPYYVVVDFEGFKQVVDQLGGVQLDVSQPMRYDDNAQDLHIRFEPGLQLLDGSQALEYVRFRDDQGDLVRIQRQQQLIKAILEKQSAELNSFERIKALLDMVIQHVTTNVPFSKLLELARQMQGLPLEAVTTVSLSGQPIVINNVSYLEPQMGRVSGMVDRYVRRKSFLLTSDVHVIVLNGKGTGGLARTIEGLLLRQGFNVEYVGNAENFNYRNTWIIPLTDDAKAQLVARALGAGQVVSREEDVVAARLQAILALCAQSANCSPAQWEAADAIVIAGADFPAS